MRLWGFCLVFPVSFSSKKRNTIRRAALLCLEHLPSLHGVSCKFFGMCSSLCLFSVRLLKKYSSICFYYTQWYTLLNTNPKGPKSRRKKTQFFKMSGFDLADLFANWRSGGIIKRKPRKGGVEESPETGGGLGIL